MDREEVLKAFDVLTDKGRNKNAIKTLCKVNLFYLILNVLKWSEYNHDWSYARINEVDEEPDNCIDLWSRGHGKSSIITVAKTLQDLINKDNIAVIIFSQTYNKAKQHTRLIKQILESNVLLKSLFTNRFYQDPANEAPTWNEKELFIKRTANRKEPTITTCGFNFALPTGLHADVLLYDDIVIEKSVATAEQIERTAFMFNQSRPLGTMSCVSRIIGTRYAHNDLFATLLDLKKANGEDVYKRRIWPATDNGLLDGKPWIFSQEHWESIIANAEAIKTVSNQYLQNPLIASERVFNVENLSYYYVKPQRMNVYILVDPAHSKKKGTNSTAMAVVGVSGRKRKYLLDGYCHKMSLIERYLYLRKLFDKWSAMPGVARIKVGYETYGSGNVDLEYIRDMLKKDQVTMSIIELESPLGSPKHKDDRIERINNDLIPHQIFVPWDTDPERLTSEQKQACINGNKEFLSRAIKCIGNNKSVYNLTTEFKKQLSMFPLGSHKDLIDAFSRIYDCDVKDPTQRRQSFEPPVEYLV